MAENTFKFNYTTLMKSSECMICHEILQEPKALPCLHTFCKECLDEYLKFHDDGSAILKCPLQCESIVEIGRTETTNSLKNNFKAQEFLDAIIRDKVTCSASKDCDNAASILCSVCNLKICQQCQRTHQCKDAEYLLIKYNNKHETYYPFCEKHQTTAYYYCPECPKQFVCIYCIHRECKQHNAAKTDKCCAFERNWLNTTLSTSQMRYDKQKICYEKEIEKIIDIRKQMQNLFWEKKVQLLSAFLRLLNEEDEKLLEYFDTQAQKFKTESKPFMSEDPHLRLNNFIDEMTTRKSYELIFGTKYINSKVKELTQLPTFQVKLINHDDDNDSLFGMELAAEVKDVEPAKPWKCVEFDYQGIENYPQDTEFHADLISLQSLLDLRGASVLHKNIPSFSVDSNSLPVNKATLETDDQSSLSIDVKRRPVVTKDADKPVTKLKIYSFHDVCNFIVKDNNIILKEILATQPDIVVEQNQYNSRNLLHIAAEAGKVVALNLLLPLVDTVQINQIDQKGWTPIMFAADKGHNRCLEALLKYTSDVDIENIAGDTSLMKASRFGHKECVGLLLAAGAQPDAINPFKETSLMLATRYKHPNCVDLLLQYGSSPDIQRNDGSTALMIGSDCSSVKSLELLVQKAKVNLQDNDGKTALMFASAKGHTPCVEILLSNGADAMMMDNKGATASSIANTCGHAACANFVFRSYPRHRCCSEEK